METATIDRAVFTSLQSRRMNGYQLAAASPGVSGEERSELTRWGPAHDALLDDDEGAVSINFHRLASGRYCVSRSFHDGAEYSGRGGWRVTTQFLLVPAESLACFANNPFRLLEAATAAGYMDVQEPLAESLAPFHLTGGATPVDRILLARLARQPGAHPMAVLVDAALGEEPLAIYGRTPLARLLAGLFSLLPIELRPRLSFSTGLKISTQRVFRLQAADPETVRLRPRRRSGEPLLLNLDDLPAGAGLAHAWAQLTTQVLERGCVAGFCAALRHAQLNESSGNLDELARSVGATLAQSSRPLATPSAVG